MGYKLDLFGLLDNISNGNTSCYGLLPVEEQKEFSPYVVQLWLKNAGNNLDARLVLMNEACNPYVFHLSNHKNLLYKTFCVAHGFGLRTRYSSPKKAGSKSASKTSEKVLMDYYHYGKQEAQDALRCLTCDDIIDIAENLGYEKVDINKIKKEFK